jgi:hypothetical protein
VRKRIHQPRTRRDCVGELVQVDGCEHWWFEDRGPQCTLLVFIDDATGRLMHLQFVESESTFAYFHAARAYLEAWGKPVAFYSDKHGVFRVNHPGALGGDGMTQHLYLVDTALTARRATEKTRYRFSCRSYIARGAVGCLAYLSRGSSAENAVTGPTKVSSTLWRWFCAQLHEGPTLLVGKSIKTSRRRVSERRSHGTAEYASGRS